MDMETSSEEEEDGQITKFEEEEEKDRKLLSKANPEDEVAILEDLESCRLSRDMIAKFCLAPWFGEYVKGMSCATKMLPTLFLMFALVKEHGFASSLDKRGAKQFIGYVRL
jgi:hypothetical protein